MTSHPQKRKYFVLGFRIIFFVSCSLNPLSFIIMLRLKVNSVGRTTPSVSSNSRGVIQTIGTKVSSTPTTWTLQSAVTGRVRDVVVGL
jgi:hypothetical protein